jgi:hypothetical protein
MKYRLNRDTRKTSCPNCGTHGSFREYMDVSTGLPLGDDVGFCDKLNRCGWHKTPRQHFESLGLGYPSPAILPPWGNIICEAPFVLRSGGVSSALTIGKNYGALTACLSVARLPWQEVTPASWSVKMVGAPPKGGWPDKAKKQAAIDLCRRELPLLNLILPGRRVPHDGIADAGAMCLYAMRGAK